MRIKVRLASLACALASFATHAALVAIVPVSQNKNIGDEVIVDIVGAGFTTPTVGGGFSLTFSGGVMSLAAADVQLAGEASLPGPWDPTSPRTETVLPGMLLDFSFSQFSGVVGNFPIARLSFNAVAPGASALQLVPSVFSFVDTIGTPLEVSFGSASVNVVPEPATWGMLATGLALVGFLSIRRQRGA